MALTVAADVTRLTVAGLSLRDAVRQVARRALAEAERGVAHSSAYLQEVHRLMVATA